MIRILPPWPEDRLLDAAFKHAKTAAKLAALCWFMVSVGSLLAVLGD